MKASSIEPSDLSLPKRKRSCTMVLFKARVMLLYYGHEEYVVDVSNEGHYFLKITFFVIVCTRKSVFTVFPTFFFFFFYDAINVFF